MVPNFLPLLALSTLLTTSGCISLFGDECNKCQKAINHMYEKMPENNCNPSWMEEAVDRINKDCPNSVSNFVVGTMVENCNNDGGLALCEVPEIFRVAVTVHNDTHMDGGENAIAAIFRFNQGDATTELLFAGETETVYFDAFDWMEYTVEWLSELDQTLTLLSSNERIDAHDSPSEWSNFRSRHVSLIWDESTSDYQFVFYDF